MRSEKRTTWAISKAVGVAALLIVLSCLAACGDSTQGRLERLRTAPMASFALDGALESMTTETKGSNEKATPSRITHSFVVVDGGLEQAFESAVEAAVDAGYEPTDQGARTYSGSQDVDGGLVMLEIIKSESENTIQLSLLSQN